MGLAKVADIADITDILPQIAADCGGKRQIVVEGVSGCVP